MRSTMGKIKDLQPISQIKLRKFAETWWGEVGPNFSEEDLDGGVGILVSVHLTSCFLHYAIECDDADLLEDLYKNGADLNQVDEVLGGLRPLQYASNLGRASIVSSLLSWGANADGVKVNYSMNPCKQPLTFMWSVKEWACGRTVDYSGVANLLDNPNSQSNRKQKCE